MNLRHAFLLLAAAAALWSHAVLPASAATLDRDWCTVEVPDGVAPGVPIVVTVTPKAGQGDLFAGQKLSVHLHWMKPNGMFGGFLSWHPPRGVEAGKPVAFTHKPKVDAGKMGSVVPLVFLSPDGDYKNRTKEVRLSGIRVGATPEAAREAQARARADAEKAAARARPATATMRRSWLRIESDPGPVSIGESFQVRVEYELDPSDDWGDGTRIELTPLGPWVDNPDGVHTTKRQHHGYQGLGTQRLPVKPGHGVVTATFKPRSSFKYNELSFMAKFLGGDGKAFPWSVRGGGTAIKRQVRGWDIAIPTPGGLFADDEAVRAEIVWGSKPPAAIGSHLAVKAIAYDTEGNAAAEWTQEVAVGAPGARAALDIPATLDRGTYALVAVLGDARRDAVFAKIPAIPAEAARKSPLGVTNVGTTGLSEACRKMGARYVRHFTSWSGFEPGRGVYRWDSLDRRVEANVAAGLQPILEIGGAPAWAMRGAGYSAGFEPFDFDEAAWRDTARAIATRYSGKIWGFEWLNEIVPGNKTQTPVQTYLDFCRIGTEEVRKADPSLKIQLAGGLWPRNFRTDLILAGISEHIDVLPIHYGDGSGVAEARRDLASAGESGARVAVWDNETASGLSTWDVPAREAVVANRTACKWMMRHWPAELCAGAEAVVFFGGHAASAGNWTCFLDEHTPRPTAATYAVLASRLAGARPLGTAYPSPYVVLHLFERDGTAFAVAATVADSDSAVATLSMHVGTDSVRRTDFQGREDSIPADANQDISVELSPMPVILEGLDLAAAAVLASIECGERGDVPEPVYTVVKGTASSTLAFRLRNPLSAPVRGGLALSSHYSSKCELLDFELRPGEERLVRMPAGHVGSGRGFVSVAWNAPALVSCTRHFSIVAIDPANLGNLLKNGGFETPGAKGPASWGSGTAHSRSLADCGTGPGFFGTALEFGGGEGWQHASQSLVPPILGRQYLYTAWVWSHDMQAGSNMGIGQKTLMIPHVFDAGRNTGFWKFVSTVKEVPPGTGSLSFTPVAKGSGWARYDNVSVSLYEGTSFAAEARRASVRPAIDGDLGEWNFAESPIPLLCENQLSAPDSYRWSPESLSAVAKLAWDDEALYMAVLVRDDRHVAEETGEDTLRSDALEIGFHPGNRTPGSDGLAFEWLVGAASPGGGSGRHTLYRPPARNGGLSSGHLAKDSSLYECAIRREGALTSYELCIPWGETGLSPAVGARAGLSLRVVDVDDPGAAAAAMAWGGGLAPVWAPSDFGVLTLLP